MQHLSSYKLSDYSGDQKRSSRGRYSSEYKPGHHRNEELKPIPEVKPNEIYLEFDKAFEMPHMGKNPRDAYNLRRRASQANRKKSGNDLMEDEPANDAK